MSKEAIAYLEEHKHSHAQETLVTSLEQAGYEPDDITASLKSVYGSDTVLPVPPRPNGSSGSFWDFTRVYEYSNRREIIFDYILGVIFPWLCLWLFSLVSFRLGWLSFAAYLFALYYFKHKRRYFYRGLLLHFYLFLLIVAVVVGFLLLNEARML